MWADLVTQESRGKLLALLDAAMQLEPMQSSARSKSRAAERASEQREGRLSEAKPSASQNEALMIWRQLNHACLAVQDKDHIGRPFEQASNRLGLEIT
ncbi:MAG: hypothetical protein EBY76_07890 [Betaproteobacteria bacterium]|nr:hypothetical protein [Betaproteobacteria bacterium]